MVALAILFLVGSILSVDLGLGTQGQLLGKLLARLYDSILALKDMVLLGSMVLGNTKATLVVFGATLRGPWGAFSAVTHGFQPCSSRVQTGVWCTQNMCPGPMLGFSFESSVDWKYCTVTD